MVDLRVICFRLESADALRKNGGGFVLMRCVEAEAVDGGSKVLGVGCSGDTYYISVRCDLQVLSGRGRDAGQAVPLNRGGRMHSFPLPPWRSD